MKNMKNEIIKDERILLQRKEIQSKAYLILTWFLLLSVLVQQFILYAPSSQFIVEFIALVCIGFYELFCYLTKGIDIWTPNKKSLTKLILTNITVTTLSCITFIFLTGDSSIKNLITYLLICTLSTVLINTTIFIIIHKKQKDIEKELNHEENNIL